MFLHHELVARDALNARGEPVDGGIEVLLRHRIEHQAHRCH
jgi:hypothetical protein